jgi:hypothetical protein
VTRLRFAVLCGLAFGVLDTLPMFAMQFPDKTAAIAGAFSSRFGIGFVIPLLDLPGPAWRRGLLIGLLLSLPEAIITGSWVPILATGALGGTLIGALSA